MKETLLNASTATCILAGDLIISTNAERNRKDFLGESAHLGRN